MRRTHPWSGFLVVVVVLVLLWSCAKRGTPPGGPPDETPPYVAEVGPSSGSVGVALDRHMSVQFSEAMKKRTVETGIVISPPSRWKKRYWKKNTYYLIPEDSLKAKTTYLISVSNKVQDAHGVSMKSTFVAGFSTGDTIDAGIISGKIHWRNVTVEAAVVELFDVETFDTAGGFPSAEPLYVTLSGSGGVYEIPFVNTLRAYRVVSFLDKNYNSERDEAEDVGCHNGEVVFGDASELRDIDVTLCGDVLMGIIPGRIDTTSVADTVTVSVEARSVSDTALVYKVSPEKSGEFEIKCVMPGPYLIGASVGDTFWVELAETLKVESCTRPREVRLGFGEDD